VSPFKILGLTRKASLIEVKRAYAKLLKTTRPDDDPEGFQRLHSAYTAALAQAQYREAEAARIAAGEVDESELFDTDDTDDDEADTNDVDPAQSLITAESTIHSNGEASSQATVEVDSSEINGSHRQAEDDAEQDIRFNYSQFLSELYSVGHDPRESVYRWLNKHPDLYSLGLKQALINPLLETLAESETPLRPVALQELLKYFQLDTVTLPEYWHHNQIEYLRKQSEDYWALDAELWALRHAQLSMTDKAILNELQGPKNRWRRIFIALFPDLPNRIHQQALRFDMLQKNSGQQQLSQESLDFWLAFNDKTKITLHRAFAMLVRCYAFGMLLGIFDEESTTGLLIGTWIAGLWATLSISTVIWHWGNKKTNEKPRNLVNRLRLGLHNITHGRVNFWHIFVALWILISIARIVSN
jgi:hypothetical protein